jgi:uncharacterized membrane protein (DUF106 family)
MDDERFAKIEKDLAELREIAEENNDFMREIRSMMRISFWSKLIIWAVVLILPFYLYSAFLAPILSGMGLGGFPSADQIKTLMDAYQGTYAE